MRTGILRIVSGFLALATLGLGSVAAYAAEPTTSVDSNRTITEDSPYGAFLFHNDTGGISAPTAPPRAPASLHIW